MLSAPHATTFGQGLGVKPADQRRYTAPLSLGDSRALLAWVDPLPSKRNTPKAEKDSPCIPPAEGSIPYHMLACFVLITTS